MMERRDSFEYQRCNMLNQLSELRCLQHSIQSIDSYETSPVLLWTNFPNSTFLITGLNVEPQDPQTCHCCRGRDVRTMKFIHNKMYGGLAAPNVIYGRNKGW